MRSLALAILIFVAPAFAQDGDPSIDAHRLGVMVDESNAALHAIAPEFPAAQPADDGDDTYSALVSATQRFATMQAQACRAKLMGPAFCGAPYDPAWLTHKPADLRAAIDEASARIAAFWSDACARAKKATGNADFCAME